MAFAHRHQVIHRDVKPGNILIDQEGRPHLTDFGLARRVAADITLTVEGQIIGTPAYMSPEQAIGAQDKVDARSDIYSRGVVLYELLTGQLPFRGDRHLLLHRVCHEEPRPLRSRDRRIPRDLDTITLKCLAKEPHGRYATADELADELRRWLASEPIRSRPVSVTGRLWRWSRRNPVVAGLTAMVAILLVVAAVVASVAYVKTSRALVRQAEQRRIVQQREAEAARQAEEAVSRLYAYQLSEVAANWQRYPTRALVMLEDVERCPEELREFTWRYFHRLCNMRPRLTLRAIGLGANPVAFSPDGKTLAVGMSTHVKLYDPATGEAIATLLVTESHVRALAFSPGGESLAAGLASGAVVLWDTSSGERRRTLKEHSGPVASVAFSPDGATLATAGADQTVKLWELEPGRIQRTLNCRLGEHACVVFSPDGRMLAVPTGDGATLFDIRSGEAKADFREHDGTVHWVAFSPDGATLATASADRTVKLWDLASGRGKVTLSDLYGEVACVEFSPDGKLLATGVSTIEPPAGGSTSAGTLKLWHAATSEEYAVPRRRRTFVYYVAFSADGKTLAVSDFRGNVELWDVGAGPQATTLLEGSSVLGDVTFSADGTMLATAAGPLAGPGDVKLWDAASGTLRKNCEGEIGWVSSLAFAPDGTLLAAGSRDGMIAVWETGNGRMRFEFKEKTSGSVSCVAFSPDGGTIAFGGGTTAQLLDVATGQVQGSLTGHGGEVLDVAFAPSSKILATASADHAVRFWDAGTAGLVRTLEGHSGAVRSLAFAPSGQTLVTAADDKTVNLWDLAAGSPEIVIKPHAEGVLAVAFASDEKTLATGGRDGCVKLWNAATGHELATLRGHVAPVAVVTFSPDGNILATGSRDGTVKLWHAASEAQVLRSKH
ncbi:MAG: serine/threonine protein kinase [Planctomycetes bacterium]|nr:serine/threonine protein kinase [Planctomycetota bacterium]MBL7038501.1 serine/threonine protein kinase [Pirellulaceae bacterium]